MEEKNYKEYKAPDGKITFIEINRKESYDTTYVLLLAKKANTVFVAKLKKDETLELITKKSESLPIFSKFAKDIKSFEKLNDLFITNSDKN